MQFPYLVNLFVQNRYPADYNYDFNVPPPLINAFFTHSMGKALHNFITPTPQTFNKTNNDVVFRRWQPSFSTGLTSGETIIKRAT